MDDIDRLVAEVREDRVRHVARREVRAALAVLGDHLDAMPAVDLRPRRRRLAALVATAGVALCAGVAVPTGAAASVATWVSARTGMFGAAGQTENDTSEYLDTSSPGMRAIVERHTARYTLPAGATWQAAYDGVLTDYPALVQDRMVAGMVARAASCAWEQEWLRAHAAGDTARRAAALAVLRAVPGWPDIAVGDPTGGQRRHLSGVARAAAAGDADAVRTDVAVNCTVTR